MKKMFSLALALILALALCVPAMAQTVDSDKGGSASITISNASKGETYKVHKLFDATVTGTKDGSIAYTGDIPETLVAYFEKDTAGNISLKADVVDNTALFEALKAWAKTAAVEAEAVSAGDALTFTGLPYGYYVITSTQDSGAAITVDSTNPNATVVDKNYTEAGSLTKNADDDNVKIGDIVTYTVSFKTATYDGAGENAKQITKYIIKDTLPEFLSNVTVTGITVGGTAVETQQFTDKTIELPWVGANGASLYSNGAEVVITYTAVVTEEAAVDGNGNKNDVTVTWMCGDTEMPGKLEGNDVIYTYAIALQKVDQTGKALAGATFQFPFFVKATADEDGAYIYAGTTAGEGLVNELTTPESGLIIVKGIEAEAEYSITETKAPNGYNKLTAPVVVTATKTGETTTNTTFYLDADGNIVETETETGSTVIVSINELAATSVVVVNKTGTELPSTGGIGTTIFYTIGGLLMAGAAILLVTKKKLANEQ